MLLILLKILIILKPGSRPGKPLCSAKDDPGRSRNLRENARATTLALFTKEPIPDSMQHILAEVTHAQ
jgi:hypothetical protein